MAERIHQLPDDFFNSNIADANIYYYQTDTSSKNNKVSFRQHLVCFLLEGHKEVLSGSDSVSFDNSKILLLSAGNSLMTETVTSNTVFKSILLFFSDNFLLDLLTRNDLKFTIKSNNSKNLKLFSKDQYILNFESSLLLLESRINKNSSLIKAKLEEILIYLFETDSKEMHGFIQMALSGNDDIPFKQIISGQDDYNLTNQELAFLCNMSTSTFKRKFAEVYGTSPKQYFISQKMDKALRLLRKKRPSEMYFELGYKNLSAFSNEFKKHFGVSPATYVSKS